MKRDPIEPGMITIAKASRKYQMYRYDVYKMIKLQEVQTYHLQGHNRIFLKESEIEDVLPVVYRRLSERDEKFSKKWEEKTEELLKEVRIKVS